MLPYSTTGKPSILSKRMFLEQSLYCTQSDMFKIPCSFPQTLSMSSQVT